MSGKGLQKGEVAIKNWTCYFTRCAPNLCSAGWACPSVSEPVPLAVEVDLSLFPLQHHLLKLPPHVEAVLVAGKPGQLIPDQQPNLTLNITKGELLPNLHPRHHWHRSLLCLQPSNELRGFWVQSSCERDAGNWLTFETLSLSGKSWDCLNKN